MMVSFAMVSVSALKRITIPFLLCVVVGQLTGQDLLYQEGFNDDGDGSRYTTVGRGQAVLEAGPGMWEHSFLVDEIGLPAIAPARRAAILTSDNVDEFVTTEDHLTIFDGLLDWMLDGKENANLLWVPGFQGAGADWYSFRTDGMGHISDEWDGAAPLPDPADVDLIIHTNSGGLTPPTLLSNFGVPVLTYNAGNHDDALISTIGAAAVVDPPEIRIVEENQSHPVLGGLSGTIQWMTEPVDLQGIGAVTPEGATILATYTDPNTNLELPAIMLVEEEGSLLGAFDPEPEGEGYFVGGDLNEDAYGDGLDLDCGCRILELNPVDVSGQENVKVTVALAATNLDFEVADFLRVLYAPDENSDFETLAEFVGVDDPASVNNKALSDGETVLSPSEFTDVTFDIPEGATNMTLRFEAFNTFPNEVIGIDNVRITAGAGLVGDCNGDGVVDVQDANCTPADELEGFLDAAGLLLGDADGDGQVQFSDFAVLAENFADAGEYTDGDFDKDGTVQFGDFTILAGNFGQTSPAAAATAAVPEPSTSVLALAGGLLLMVRRRRR